MFAGIAERDERAGNPDKNFGPIRVQIVKIYHIQYTRQVKPPVDRTNIQVSYKK